METANSETQQNQQLTRRKRGRPKSERPKAGPKVWRIGRHHFAHLRAIAEGVDVHKSADAYLGIFHGHQAKNAHEDTVAAVRAVARRHKEPAWRLIGLLVQIPAAPQQPSLADYIEERGLQDWSEDEARFMFLEDYPADMNSPKVKRRENLRLRQLAMLRRLEELATELPSPTDPVGGWFDAKTAKMLVGAGMLNLGDMLQKIAIGGRWYSGLPGVGVTKARRLSAFLSNLLGHVPALPLPTFALDTDFGLFAEAANDTETADLPAVIPTSGPSTTHPPMLAAKSDSEVVDAWIAARAGSPFTAKAYKREATRLMMWLKHEANNRTFRSMTAEDCANYMTFLQHIPDRWISRTRAAPGAPGWAPFRGQLKHDSQALAITTVAALFRWLHAADYRKGNPWVLVNLKTGDDKDRDLLDTKAFSETAMGEILHYIEEQKSSPSQARIKFVLRFVESVGLRSAELLSAKVDDLSLTPEGWTLQVMGKGAKKRVVTIPAQALSALDEYLNFRGLKGVDSAPKEAPIVSSATHVLDHVGYQAMYENVKLWLGKAISNAAISDHERDKIRGASVHWLRHTFGTRAVARGVPLDVVQGQMGHTSPTTTANLYARAPLRRRAEELQKAFG